MSVDPSSVQNLLILIAILILICFSAFPETDPAELLFGLVFGGCYGVECQ